MSVPPIFVIPFDYDDEEPYNGQDPRQWVAAPPPNPDDDLIVSPAVELLSAEDSWWLYDRTSEEMSNYLAAEAPDLWHLLHSGARQIERRPR